MQKASSVCACVRRGGDDGILEIVSAHSDGGLGGFWTAGLTSAAPVKTCLRSLLIVHYGLKGVQWR